MEREASGAGAAQRKDIGLTQTQKEGLVLFIVLIFIALAVSVILFDYIAPRPVVHSAYYPNNCGEQPGNISSCVADYANATENVSVCAYLQNFSRNSCVLGVAMKTGNADTCTYINTTVGAGYSIEQYSNCILALNRKPGSMYLCNGLSSTAELECLYNVTAAHNFSDLDDCSSLSNPAFAEQCSALYYYKQAVQTKSPAPCGRLQAEANATTLYLMSLGNQTSFNGTRAGLGVLLYSYVNVSPRDLCYYNIALATNSTATCNLYVSGSLQSACVSAVTGKYIASLHFDLNATNSSAACGMYSNSSVSAACYYYYAVGQALKEQNPGPCLSLNITQNHDLCLFLLATNTSKSTYCNDVTNSTLRQACLITEEVETNQTG